MIVLRLIWTLSSNLRRRRDERVPASYLVVIGWAGMRGVVTLAAAFVIPEGTPNREILLLVAFTVVAGTLFLQGFSLGWLARRLRVPSPDPLEDALARAALLEQASEAGLVRLAEIERDDEHGVCAVIRQRVDERNFAAWERLGSDRTTPSEAYAVARLEMIGAERAEVLRVRSSGTVSSEVVAGVLAQLDVEESMIDRVQRSRPRSSLSGQSTQGGVVTRELCEHLTADDARSRLKAVTASSAPSAMAPDSAAVPGDPAGDGCPDRDRRRGG